MCFWAQMALFNCDGTVERQKHLCRLVPYDGHRAGVEICKNYETPSGCKHSNTSRAIPQQAIYRHVCDRSRDAYGPPTRSGIRPKWTPTIKEPVQEYVTGRRENGAEVHNGVQFRWCDGTLCTVEDVVGRHAGSFNWRGVDLLQVDHEEVCRLVGKGTYEHWVKVWKGEMEE